MLRLAARGYTPAQVAALLDTATARVLAALGRAAAALAAPTVGYAAEEAKRRGLIA